MPGLVMKMPGSFPGVSSLPDPLRRMMENVFPQDSLALPAMTGIGGPRLVQKLSLEAPVDRSNPFMGPRHSKETFERLTEVFRPKDLTHALAPEPSRIPPAPQTAQQIKGAFTHYNELLQQLLQREGGQ
jgi:hypothetical protein